MPVHDWTRVSAGTFQDFHNGWITPLIEALNGGVLTDGFYAQTRQRASEVDDDPVFYATRRRTLVIRHSSGYRIVALIEIVSPGNKATRDKLDDFLDKTVSALQNGYHLLIVDLFPPGAHDPHGVHAALWNRLGTNGMELPDERPLALASYLADQPPTAYVKYAAVGTPHPSMPLFLDPGWYVNAPLEDTCTQAWRGVPQYWRSVIEGENST